MKLNRIIDPIYGKIEFPKFINSLLTCPELLRLKEIRMSNINFFNFTGFSDTSRYEHAVGTAYLVYELTNKWNLSQKERFELITAALFHDIATPPFGHGTEIVLKEKFGFDHEEETAKVILGLTSEFRKTDIGPIYADEVPKLKRIFEKTKNPKLDVKNVYSYILGKRNLGKLIKGKIDIDNIDNVLRAAYHIGLKVDKKLPFELANSFIYERDGTISFNHDNRKLLNKWLDVRNDLYTHLLLNTEDLNREVILKYAIKKAIDLGVMKKTDWIWTDNELINKLTNIKYRDENYGYLRDLMNRVKLGIFLKEIGLYWISDPVLYSRYKNDSQFPTSIENELSGLLGTDILVNLVPDKRNRLINDFRLSKKDPIFESLLPEGENIQSFGKELINILLCVYSVQPTLIKRDLNGKPLLDDNRKQIKYKLSELKKSILVYLKKYLGNSDNISLYSPKVLNL